ncbi:MAG: dephospho-CoA kinase [Muribaculaceae bacterium]|nr:dephospho-CoA kinase [Muribaculaceae bacterium]
MESCEKCIIGITGGIGAGKSVVSRILRLKGYWVYDCDLEAKILMDQDMDVRNALKELFSESIYLEDGTLDRKLMADKIFSDENIRNYVNRIVHSAVKSDFISRAGRNGSPVFVESAILHTSGLDSICSRIWLVDAPVDVRINRVVERNGMSAQQIEARMSAQQGEFDLFDRNKIDVIDNSGDVSLLYQINNLLETSNQK